MENSLELTSAKSSSPVSLPSLTENSFVSLVERYKDVPTVAAAVTLQEPAIAAIVEDNGIDKVTAAFRLQLSRFAADIHVRDTLTENDIQFIAEQLATDTEYKWLKLADIAILMKRIRMNKYGKLYQSMNAGTFFECLDKYCAERTMEIERIQAQDAQSMRNNLRDVKLPYSIGEDGRICVNPTAKKEGGNGDGHAEKVANMAKVYAAGGMQWSEAVATAARQVEQTKKS